MKWTKWELSLMIGLAVMLLFCAVHGQNTLQWWSAAFSPLCDGILSQNTTGGIVVKSKLMELLAQLMSGTLCFSKRTQLPFQKSKKKDHNFRCGLSGGDKRDRTADLLTASQALSRLVRLHTPLNRAETALQYTGNLVIAYNS